MPLHLPRPHLRRLLDGLPRQRRRRLGALALLIVAVLTLTGLLQVRLSTNATTFLPSHDPTVSALQREASQFGGDPIVVLLEARQHPDQEGIQNLLTNQTQLTSLLRLEGELSKLHNVASVYGPATLLNQIATAGQDFLSTLAGRRLGVQEEAEQAAQKAGETPDQVTAAGQAAQSAFDLRYAPLLVKALPAGLPTLSNPEFVQEVVFSHPGTPRAEWHFVVPTASTVAVLIRPSSILSQQDTQRLVASVRGDIKAADLDTDRVTITGVPVVITSLATDVEHELPLIGGLVAIILAVRFLFAPSQLARRYRYWPLVATIAGTAVVVAGFGWARISLSAASLAVLPLFIGIGSSFPLFMLTLFNRRRIIVMALASAAGFLSLAISPLPIVRQLGVALGASVVMIILTALIVPVPPPTRKKPRRRRNPDWSAPKRWSALVAVLVVAAGGWFSLSQFTVQANPEALANGLPALKTATYAQGVLGYAGELDVVLHGPNVLSTEGLAWQRKAESALLARYGSQLRAVLTVPDLVAFLGANPTASQITDGVRLLPAYLTTAVLLPTQNGAVEVFGAKLSGLAPSTIAGIRSTLPKPPAGYSVQLVGLPAAAARGYHLLSTERYLENLAGIAAAGIVLAIGLRRKKDALRAVLASLMAAGWGLIGLWALGWSLNPLTITLGSLTAVAAGEFVVLLSEARNHGIKWLPRSVAIAAATSTLGYASLAVSNLNILRQFGVVLAASVVLSYLAAEAVTRLLPSEAPAPPPSLKKKKKKDLPLVLSS